MFVLSSESGVDAVAKVAVSHARLPESFSAPQQHGPPRQIGGNNNDDIDESGGGGGGGGSSGGYVLRVTVSDPQRTAGGASPGALSSLALPPLSLATPHLSYRVAGKSTLPGYGGSGPSSHPAAPSRFSVRRRFSEFEAHCGRCSPASTAATSSRPCRGRPSWTPSWRP